ncbi:LPXTG cell wall anchor domain-containing protein [Faecalibaculum rodentium]|uniref:Prealbumin-like fold domain-containing protein n=1 Tax=Faecalibaculum rodentium TaxID=1702221 RepID=A0A140DYR6_9FIRM|nr:LPXTG cell wall anchor domain-containing protein [Faecalibaculum rodentium]AMK55793.1 hypothetical protein AALO17_26590 [Faecalibaculum rodentium]
MKGILRKLWILLLIPLFAAMPVAAQDIDLNERGSLTISFNGKYPLEGSSYAIWQVATIGVSEDGPYEYQNAPGFEGIRFHFTEQDLNYWDADESHPLIEFVGDYIDQEGLQPYATRTIGESNTVTFSDLPLGIYYVRQTELGEAGYVMTSYLATIPDKSGSYDATSFGKTDSYRKKPTKPSKAKTAAELQQDQFLMLAGISLSVLALVVLWRRKKEA